MRNDKVNRPLSWWEELIVYVLVVIEIAMLIYGFIWALEVL